MTTYTQLKQMDPAEVRKMSAKLAKQLAARIAVGVVVTVSVALISNAVLVQIEEMRSEKDS